VIGDPGGLRPRIGVRMVEVARPTGVGRAISTYTNPIEGHGWYQSLNLTLPPLGALFLGVLLAG